MGSEDPSTASTLRFTVLLVAAVGLLTGSTAAAAGSHGSVHDAGLAEDTATETPASHDSGDVPGAAEGYLVEALADAQAPTVITFAPGPDALDALPGTQPVRDDLYYANLAGEIVHVDLAWTPLGPDAVDRTVLAEGFNQPLGVAFDDGEMYVADSYDHEVADRPAGVVYEVDPGTGQREAIVDGIPNGQHNVNHIRFGPDDRLYLPVGNPNDSGNGTGTGHTDIFPYTGAFLSVDVDRLATEGPAVLHWEDEQGDPIEDDEIVDHPRNQDFAAKVDVLAFGFRNVFDITWAPEDLPFASQAYTATNGADNPNSLDTLEQIHPNTHHGYPFCVSQGNPGQVTDLGKEHWDGSPHTGVDCQNKPPAEALLGYHVCATGLDFPTTAQQGYPDFTFPEESRSSVFVGECAFFQAQNTVQETLEHPSRHNTAHKVTQVRLDETGSARDVDPFLEGLALPTDVQFGPDGAMYVADAGTILRVAPTPAAGLPPIDLVPTPASQDNEAPVLAVGQSFAPQILVVPNGTTLEWTSGAIPHTVTSSEALCSPDGTHCEGDGDFDGALSGVADTYRRTFDQPGVFPYFCEFHYQLGMTGLVVVLDPEDPTAVGPEAIVDALGGPPAGPLDRSGSAGHGHLPGPG